MSKLVLPLTPAQDWLMHYFRPPYKWYVYSTFTIRTKLDLGIIQKIVANILEYNEVLRIFLDNNDGKWSQWVIKNIDPKRVCPKIFVADMSKKVTFLEKKLIEEKAKSLNINIWPLFYLIPIKISRDQYRITFVLHHIIADYVSCIFLYNQFCIFHSNDCIPLVKKNHLYSDYCLRLQNLKRNPDVRKQVLSYWERERAQQSAATEIEPSKLRGIYLKEFSVVATKALTNNILRLAKKYYAVKSLHPILSAPLYVAVSCHNNHEKITISHKLHGRNLIKQNYFNMVGNCAINVPITQNVRVGASFKKIVHSLSNKIEQMPLNGLGYDLFLDNWSLNMYPDNLVTDIRICYLGNINILNHLCTSIEYDKFSQRYNDPRQPLTIPIEVVIFVHNNQFHIRTIYTQKCYSEDYIKTLTESYLENLGKLFNE